MVGTGVGATRGVLIKGGQTLESAHKIHCTRYAKKFRDDEDNPVWREARDFESITRHGVKAIVRKKEIIVGNKSLMFDLNINISIDAEEMLAEAEGMAQNGILVSIDRELAAVLNISDPLKPSAREVISILKYMNVKSIMVTGDNWGTSRSNAKEVGIDIVVAEAKPEYKAEIVMQNRYAAIVQFSHGLLFQLSLFLAF